MEKIVFLYSGEGTSHRETGYKLLQHSNCWTEIGSILDSKFNLKLEVILTDGSQPIGNGIGPVLEIIDVIKVLKRQSPPKDLEEKSIMLAGKLLEMTGKAKKG